MLHQIPRRAYVKKRDRIVGAHSSRFRTETLYTTRVPPVSCGPPPFVARNGITPLTLAPRSIRVFVTAMLSVSYTPRANAEPAHSVETPVSRGD